MVDRTLMLFGGAQACAQAHHTLARWHRQGHRWVGDPGRWHIEAVDNYHRAPHDLPERWAVWIDPDLDAFSRTFNTLSRLREHGGPAHVLAMHTGFSRQGLLNNLREAAQRYLGMRLLLIDEITPAEAWLSPKHVTSHTAVPRLSGQSQQ